MGPRAQGEEEGEAGGEEHGEDALADEAGGEDADAVDEKEFGEGPEGLELKFHGDVAHLVAEKVDRADVVDARRF